MKSKGRGQHGDVISGNPGAPEIITTGSGGGGGGGGPKKIKGPGAESHTGAVVHRAGAKKHAGFLRKHAGLGK
jgi:hypothetical protein